MSESSENPGSQFVENLDRPSSLSESSGKNSVDSVAFVDSGMDTDNDVAIFAMLQGRTSTEQGQKLECVCKCFAGKSPLLQANVVPLLFP